MFSKPERLLKRDREWDALNRFATDSGGGSTFGLVYGRRRQGKTLLLGLMAEACNGFVFSAKEQSLKQNLNDFAHDLATYTNSSAPLRLENWQNAFDALLELSTDKPVFVVFDEFPYLLDASPELPSVIQVFLSPTGKAIKKSKLRIVVCGSAFSVMSGLLSANAPLRGRAILELVVQPFDFREAADFWGIDNWELAMKVNALCGGTPAYKDFCRGDLPTERNFDSWVGRNLLNPSSAFFREGRTLLSEEPAMADKALYFAVLSAIGDGKTRRGQIAAALQRNESTLAHPLTVLEEVKLIDRVADPVRSKRSTFHISDPMLRFHQSVIRPNEIDFIRGDTNSVWHSLQQHVSSRVYGPHFEYLARDWTEFFFADGNQLGAVGPTEVSCKSHKTQHEIDVAGVDHEGKLRVLGEAKWWNAKVGLAELDRLRHIRSLYKDSDDVRLLLFSRKGFDAALTKEASKSEDVELVDLERLYAGN